MKQLACLTLNEHALFNIFFADFVSKFLAWRDLTKAKYCFLVLLISRSRKIKNDKNRII